MQEALQLVKQELGPEAVILFTKKVKKGGVFGLFGTELVEVTAGVDASLDPDLAPMVPAVGGRKSAKTGFFLDEPPRRREASLPAKSYLRMPGPERQREVFQSELNEGKVLSGPAVFRGQSAAKAPSWHPEVARFEAVLKKSGVEEDVIKRLLDQANLRIQEEGYPRSGSVSQVVRDCLSGCFKVSGPVDTRAGLGRPRVAAFIGPTGVGKTTTLVKLASQYSLLYGKKTCLITADTYRIGAVEQLKIYRDIIDIPLEVANRPSDFPGIFKKHPETEIFFMDTAGRSPQNRNQIQDLKGFLEAARPEETHLVISATTKNSDLMPIVAKFGLVHVQRFLYTKLDETRSHGLALNLAANFSLPVSYLTFGQNVPNDIEVATPERLADLVLGEAHGRPG
jgi:flagellar biosynthesis protein FlhF